MANSVYGAALAELYDRHAIRGGASTIEPDWTVFAEIELFRLTGERRYLDAIARAIRARLDAYASNGIVAGRLTGFKLPARIGYAARLLVREDVLAGGETERLREFLVDLLMHAEYERGAMNRAVGFMAALRPVLDVVGTHPRADDLRALEELVLSDWTSRWEPVEDAYGYEAITLLFVLMWFEESGRDELVRSAPMAAALDRLLATRSNDGSGVVFGDWRPHDRVPGHYLAIFERAASLLGDGRYRWIAERLWDTWCDRRAGGTEAGPESLFGLALASCWADRRVEAVAPTDGSLVLRRGGLPNKLIVRHGRQPDGLFAMVSLAHGHEHSHNDSLAVNAIMRGGTTLIGDNGRNRPEQGAHNLPASADDLSALMDGAALPPGRWVTLRFDARAPRGWGHFSRDVSIPVEAAHFVPNTLPPEFDYDPARQSTVCFGVTGRGRCELVVKEMALAGPAGSVDLLADHGRGGGWIGGGPGADGTARFELDLDAENVYRATEGFSVSHVGRVLPFPLDLDAGGYDRLDLTIALYGDGPQTDVHFLCLGDRACVPKKWKPVDSPQGAATVERFEASADRTTAVLSLDDLVPSGRERTRRRGVFAFGRRALWVSDAIGYRDALPFAAAQLWHSRREPEDLGDGWYVVGDEAPLFVGLVRVDADGSVHPETSGVIIARSDDPERHNPYTLAATRRAGGGRTARFDALLVAPLPGEDPGRLLATLRIESAAGEPSAASHARGESHGARRAGLPGARRAVRVTVAGESAIVLPLEAPRDGATGALR